MIYIWLFMALWAVFWIVLAIIMCKKITKMFIVCNRTYGVITKMEELSQDDETKSPVTEISTLKTHQRYNDNIINNQADAIKLILNHLGLEVYMQKEEKKLRKIEK